MICYICGGTVTWRGPLVALTHTQCENCGERNCQVVELEEAMTEPLYDKDDLPGMLAVAKGVVEQTWPHTMDAAVWAAEFVKRYPGHDEGDMIGWFANAIMAGYDTALSRVRPESGSSQLSAKLRGSRYDYRAISDGLLTEAADRIDQLERELHAAREPQAPLSTRRLCEHGDGYNECPKCNTAFVSASGACPYCTSDNEAIRATYFDQNCKGCVSRMPGNTGSAPTDTTVHSREKL